MLNLTDSAVLKMKEVLQQVNLPDHGIRIFMSPGG
jgi:Fe-S cluster assembly iron-binding protein IscA